jgi:hypothetical protein
MNESKNIININPNEIFHSLIAGLLLNAFLSSLSLKKMSGIDLTEGVRIETLENVIRLHGLVSQAILDAARKGDASKSSGVPPQKGKDLAL